MSAPAPKVGKVSVYEKRLYRAWADDIRVNADHVLMLSLQDTYGCEEAPAAYLFVRAHRLGIKPGDLR